MWKLGRNNVEIEGTECWKSKIEILNDFSISGRRREVAPMHDNVAASLSRNDGRKTWDKGWGAVVARGGAMAWW